MLCLLPHWALLPLPLPLLLLLLLLPLLLLLVQAGVVPGVKLVLEEPISITSFALSLLLVFRWGLQA